MPIILKSKMKIESVNSVYRALFAVTFVHNAYAMPNYNFFSQGMSIKPDEKTAALFRDLRIDYRFYNDTLICVLGCKPANPPAPEPKTPAKQIADPTVLRFLLKCRDDFFDKTYTVATEKKVYQFSNTIDNVAGNVFLTAPVESFAAANSYDAGTIVKNGGKLYSAVKPVAVGSAIADITHWKKLTVVEQVVNNADLQDEAAVQPDEKCFGVIDIHKVGTTNNIYKILNAADALIQPPASFIIKFLSKF